MTGKHILAAAGGVGLAGAAFFWFAPYNIAASQEHLPGVGEALHQYLRNSVNQRAEAVEIPPQVDLADAGLVRLGAGHFATGCATCHGAPGIPRNPVVQGMQPEPPMLTSEDFTPEGFWWIARHGFKYTGMPAWPGEAREVEPWALAAFLMRYDSFDRQSYEEAAFGRAGAYDGDAIRLGGLPGAIPPEVTCARCHGEDGMGRDGTAPKLAGQSETWLVQVLDAYASDHRQSGFMEPIAAPLSDDNRATLAARYAAMPGDWQGRALAMGDAARGEELAQQGSEHDDIASCASCHLGEGADGLSPRRADTPRIAGQEGYWIYNWLLMYRDGPVPETERGHLMEAAARWLDDEDIADLAAYFAAL